MWCEPATAAGEIESVGTEEKCGKKDREFIFYVNSGMFVRILAPSRPLAHSKVIK